MKVDGLMGPRLQRLSLCTGSLGDAQAALKAGKQVGRVAWGSKVKLSMDKDSIVIIEATTVTPWTQDPADAIAKDWFLF